MLMDEQKMRRLLSWRDKWFRSMVVFWLTHISYERRVLGNRSKSGYVAYWVEGGEQPISPGISFCWSRFYLAFIILSCSFLHRPCYGGAAMKIIRWGFPSLEEAFQALLACQVGKLKLTGFAEPVLSKGHLLERLQSLPSIRLCLLSSKWLRANLL